MRRGLLALSSAAALAALAGCPAYGIIDDGTSVSWGTSNRGALLRPALLPPEGDGYWVPPRWARRGLSYGTDELVDVIVHVGRRLHRDQPGRVLGVADLSPRRGGPSAWHRSHQTGRDVDLLFFAVDAAGAPVRLDQMVRFRPDGTAELPLPDGERAPIAFDVARNWYLVRALIDNPIAHVQYVFVYEPLEQLMLDHARAIGEPEAVILLAGDLLMQPGDSLAHDDHMHVRVFCASTDRSVGCEDRGRIRWLKKLYKYAPEPAGDRADPAAALAGMQALATTATLGAP